VNDSLHQMTPLDVATKRRHEDIKEILREAVSTTVSNLSLRYSQHFHSTCKKYAIVITCFGPIIDFIVFPLKWVPIWMPLFPTHHGFIISS